VIVELITYIPLVFLVILFRKTKSKKKRSNNLKKILQINYIDESVDFKSKSEESNEYEEKHKSFKFPWFFKIILYSISLFIIASSNLFVLFKGNSQIFFKYSTFEFYNFYLFYFKESNSATHKLKTG
jgi:hypothetical protein